MPPCATGSGMQTEETSRIGGNRSRNLQRGTLIEMVVGITLPPRRNSSMVSHIKIWSKKGSWRFKLCNKLRHRVFGKEHFLQEEGFGPVSHLIWEQGVYLLLG